MKNNKTCSYTLLLTIAFITLKLTPAKASALLDNNPEKIRPINGAFTTLAPITKPTFDDLVARFDLLFSQNETNKALRVIQSLSKYPEFKNWDLKQKAYQSIVDAFIHKGAMLELNGQPELQIACYLQLLQWKELEDKAKANFYAKIGMIHYCLKNWYCAADACLEAEEFSEIDDLKIMADDPIIPIRFHVVYLRAAISALKNRCSQRALKYFTRIAKLPNVDSSYRASVIQYIVKLKKHRVSLKKPLQQ